MNAGSSFASSCAIVRADSMLNSPFGGKISNETGCAPVWRACAKMFSTVSIMLPFVIFHHQYP